MKFFGPHRPERVLLRRNTLYCVYHRVQLLVLGRPGAGSGVRHPLSPLLQNIVSPQASPSYAINMRMKFGI